MRSERAFDSKILDATTLRREPRRYAMGSSCCQVVITPDGGGAVTHLASMATGKNLGATRRMKNTAQPVAVIDRIADRG